MMVEKQALVDKTTSGELLKLLRNTYSIKQTIFELQQEFYAREQLSSESLHDYSQVLMKKNASHEEKCTRYVC